MSTAEIVVLLPERDHEFVREAMARQIRRAATFGRAPEGGCVLDRHAQLAGRTLAWATAELAEAFPSESWFRSPQMPVAIPGTVEELLERLPSAGVDRRRVGQTTRRAVPRRAEDRYHWREAELPSRFQESVGTAKRRVAVMLWAVKVAEWLPRGDGPAGWLLRRANRSSERALSRIEQPVRVR
jgi:hypothetical protein